ncbi:hypothetical protein SEA_LITTLEFELLA_56 [Gordonia phage LittleFella]|nr:hypothetical protein SEA_LITTLEFELLA_56 [Gordonia phage LittleFella]
MTASKGVRKYRSKSDEARFSEMVRNAISEMWTTASAPQIAKYIGVSEATVRGQVVRMKREGTLPERAANYQSSPGTIGKNCILIAKSCPKCGLILDAVFFQKMKSGFYSTCCNTCRSRHFGSRNASEGNDWKKAMQKATLPMAVNNGKPWSDDPNEDEILRSDKTIFEKALVLGRTYAATAQEMRVRGYSRKRINDKERFDSRWIIRFPEAMKVLQEEFRKLGVPEEEFMWND